MVPKTSPAQATTEDRFWVKVDRRSGAECWPWRGYVDEKGSGYGQFWNGSRLVKAHRQAFTYSSGAVPDGLVVDHACHNEADCKDVPCAHRACVNPGHLEAVSQSVNSIRGHSGDHQLAKTQCPHGHPYSPENTILRRNGKHRVCRECSRAHSRNYNARRKAA